MAVPCDNPRERLVYASSLPPKPANYLSRPAYPVGHILPAAAGSTDEHNGGGEEGERDDPSHKVGWHGSCAATCPTEVAEPTKRSRCKHAERSHDAMAKAMLPVRCCDWLGGVDSHWRWYLWRWWRSWWVVWRWHWWRSGTSNSAALMNKSPSRHHIQMLRSIVMVFIIRGDCGVVSRGE